MAIYTCLLLDIDNTLLDYDTAERQALIDTLLHFNLPYNDESIALYHDVNRKLWTSLAKGQINKNKLFSVRFSRFLQMLNLPDDGSSRRMNDFYEVQLSLHSEKLPGALQALDALSEVATLAAVTNGTAKVQGDRIREAGIEPYLDGIYISEKMGVRKPQARFYEMILEDLGISDRSKVLIVGDDLSADVQGGMNANIDTCWFNLQREENATKICPTHTVYSYQGLYEVVMEPEELEMVGIQNPRHRNDL